MHLRHVLVQDDQIRLLLEDERECVARIGAGHVAREPAALDDPPQNAQVHGIVVDGHYAALLE